jgi:hypothetical protein
MKAMARGRESRYGSAEEMQQAIRSVQHQLRAQSPPSVAKPIESERIVTPLASGERKLEQGAGSALSAVPVGEQNPKGAGRVIAGMVAVAAR